MPRHDTVAQLWPQSVGQTGLRDRLWQFCHISSTWKAFANLLRRWSHLLIQLRINDNAMSERLLTDWKVIDRSGYYRIEPGVFKSESDQSASIRANSKLFIQLYIQFIVVLVNIILVLHHEASWIMNQGSGFIQDSQLEFRILNE